MTTTITPKQAAEAVAITDTARFWIGRSAAGRVIFDREPNPADYPWLEITGYVCTEIGAASPAAPAADDLLEVVRTLCAIAARMRELPDEKRHFYPSPTAEGSPVLAAARAACVARGYTADGLAVAGVAYPATAPVADAAPAWISVADERKPIGRTPILVAVSYVRYGEHEDGTPGEFHGQTVAEGEFVPQHGEAGNYFTCYSSPHGDAEEITHWMPIPAAPAPTEGQ